MDATRRLTGPKSAARAISVSDTPVNLTPGWGFLYSDCTHEVLPVTAGSRLTLAYNVYADKSPEQLLGRTQISETNLYARIRAVAAVNGSKKQLAFGMSHVYPQPNKRHGDRTILPQHLKGVDLLIYNIAKALGLIVETGVILIKPDEPEHTDDEDEDEDRDDDYEDASQTSGAIMRIPTPAYLTIRHR